VPYVMHPRQMRETFKPVLPRRMYSMLFLLRSIGMFTYCK
jgi:hypothetical protein